jgi:arylsulfatase A-like enzyme
VNRADDLVATWLEAIDRLGLAERTAVIVLSDHGEEFWEHTNRGSSHGHTLYDEVLRVPLIWVEPGAIAAGGVVTEPVSLIDVVPTIAVRFGLVPPAISDGVDLSPLLDGGSWSVDRPIFAESIRDGATRVSVRTKRGKLIAMTGPPKPRSDRALCDPPVLPDVELFLANDRSESDDRIGRADGLERELQALIATHLRQAKAALKDAPATVIDAETEEALRRLGYIE